jgi:ABC-type nickel/cobalt efflux system permease component RcnA
MGLLHGVEPGHGWPVAVLYSMNKRRAILNATISSGIIGLAHLVSSIAVVAAYVLLQRWLDFDVWWLKYVAAGVLLVLAVKLFLEKTDGMANQHGHLHENQQEVEHEHEHVHPGKAPHTHMHKHSLGVKLSLLGLATFAFILGFAHEEEFALLALVVGGVNAWILMLSYGISVLLGLVLVTILCVKIYKQFQPKLMRYEKYVPKISAVFLVAMALIVVFW